MGNLVWMTGYIRVQSNTFFWKMQLLYYYRGNWWEIPGKKSSSKTWARAFQEWNIWVLHSQRSLYWSQSVFPWPRLPCGGCWWVCFQLHGEACKWGKLCFPILIWPLSHVQYYYLAPVMVALKTFVYSSQDQHAAIVVRLEHGGEICPFLQPIVCEKHIR